MKFVGWDIGIKNMSYCLIEKLESLSSLNSNNIDNIDNTIDNINNTIDNIDSSNINNSINNIDNDNNLINQLLNSKKIINNTNNIINNNQYKSVSNEKEEDNIFILGNNIYKIIKWGVINIVPKVTEKEEEKGEIMLIHRPNMICSCEISKKINGSTLCRKKAVACKIAKNADGTYQGFCANHLKKSNLSYDEYVEVKVGSCQCCVLDDSKLSRCKTKSVYVNKEHHFMGYCRKHYNNYIKNLKKEQEKKNKIEEEINFLKIIGGKKVSSINLTQLSDALYQELDNIPELLDAHVVLLENQPVLKNPTMKSMQMFLYSYYVLKGYQNNNKNVNNIQCYMASKKLDLIKFVSEDVYRNIKGEIKNVKSQYSKNKKMAIRLTENLLKNNSYNCDDIKLMFENSKKKDDLSDSLLMTLHYLERDILKKIIIPESYGSPILERKKKYSKKKSKISEESSEENTLKQDDTNELYNNVEKNGENNLIINEKKEKLNKVKKKGKTQTLDSLIIKK
tara:strand:- start:4933 stop:6456 length:1524 start_codon:yes stop_codon:yes gene_type:complete